MHRHHVIPTSVFGRPNLSAFATNCFQRAVPRATVTYRVGYEGGAEQFREKIGALLRASADDFTVSLVDRNKSFEAVVDSFVAGKDIVAARKSGEIAGFVLFTRGGEIAYQTFLPVRVRESHTCG